MLIPHKGHTDTIQVYSVTVMTHVKALQAGHSSQGTSEPITPVTISLTCRHMLTYIAVSVVILVIYHRHRPYLYCHVGDIIDYCDNIGSNIAMHLHCCVSSNY